jgi:hypothetical protein
MEGLPLWLNWGRLATWGQVHNLYTPILRPRSLVIAHDCRAFGAIAHRSKLRLCSALQQQRAPYRLGAALAEPDVVFA